MTPSEPLRLHPASLLFAIYPLLRSFLVPAALVYFFADDDSWQVWLSLLIIPIFVFQAYRILTLRYQHHEDELVVTVGKWLRNERHIPYERIQNIDLVQDPIQRLFKVGEVSIETASGAKPEASLNVLSLVAVADLREAIRARQLAKHGAATLVDDEEELAEEGASETDSKPLLELSVQELLRLAVDPGRSLAPVAVMAGIAYEFDLFERYSVRDRVEQWQEAGGFGFGWIDGVLIGLAAIVALTAFSIVGTFLVFSAFRLDLKDEQFRLRRGLLTRVRATIPRRRVQIVTVHESLLHRWMGRARLRIGTAGGHDEDTTEKEASWLAPLIPRSRVDEFLERIDPRLRFESSQWRTSSRDSLRRARRLAVIRGVVFGVALLVFLLVSERNSLQLALVPAPVAYFWWRATCRHRNRGWQMTEQFVAYRSGFLSHRTTFVLFEKVQSCALHHSYFDRRWNMASLSLDTAGGGQSGQHVAIRYLPHELARALDKELVGRAQVARFDWN